MMQGDYFFYVFDIVNNFLRKNQVQIANIFQPLIKVSKVF